MSVCPHFLKSDVQYSYRYGVLGGKVRKIMVSDLKIMDLDLIFFVWIWSKIHTQKISFLADFALQNMV